MAYVEFQPATPTERGIAERLEKAQKAALDRGRGAHAAERGNVLHRGLADTSRILSCAARNARIEAYRSPVHELERFHLGVDAAGDFSERERARQQIQI